MTSVKRRKRVLALFDDEWDMPRIIIIIFVDFFFRIDD